MSVFLEVDDLLPFVPDVDGAKAEAMIADAEAWAVLVAPCLADPDFDNFAGVRAVLRGAVLRWLESGSGVVSSQSAGPFGMSLDTRQERRGMFWPSELVQFQKLCAAAGGSSGTAFSIDQSPNRAAIVHLDTCSVNFGSSDCTCGAILLSGTLP